MLLTSGPLGKPAAALTIRRSKLLARRKVDEAARCSEARCRQPILQTRTARDGGRSDGRWIQTTVLCDERSGSAMPQSQPNVSRPRPVYAQWTELNWTDDGKVWATRVIQRQTVAKYEKSTSNWKRAIPCDLLLKPLPKTLNSARTVRFRDAVAKNGGAKSHTNGSSTADTDIRLTGATV